MKDLNGEDIPTCEKCGHAHWLNRPCEVPLTALIDQVIADAPKRRGRPPKVKTDGGAN